ncbi:MAG: alpha/beta hydrolase [Dehalococcoidia bacterium]
MKFFERDGVKLCYEDEGSGDPPLVLIHGWTCNSTYMAPQVDHFQREHRVVALDLRGHGQSGKPEQDYDIGVYADDTVALIDNLGLKEPVIIGHSMGGLVALDIGARYPDIPSAIVMLDSPVLLREELRPLLGQLVEAFRGPGYAEAQRNFVESFLFIPSDDPELKRRTLDGMSSSPQRVMADSFASLGSFESAAAAAACKVPALYIDDEADTADLKRLKELCPQLLTGKTVGAGHFHQLLVPEQVNAMIERFLELVKSGQAGVPKPVAVTA